MKNALTIAAAFLIGPCVSYLWFAFIQWDWSPGAWSLDIRFLASVLAFGGGVAMGVIAYSYTETHGRNGDG